MERKDRRASRSAQLRVTSAVPPRSRRPAFGAALGRVAAVAGMLLSASVGAQEGGPASLPEAGPFATSSRAERWDVGFFEDRQAGNPGGAAALLNSPQARELALAVEFPPSTGKPGRRRSRHRCRDRRQCTCGDDGRLARRAGTPRSTACAGYSRPRSPSAPDAGHRGAGELQKALERERERNRAMALELTTVTKKLETLQAARPADGPPTAAPAVDLPVARPAAALPAQRDALATVTAADSPLVKRADAIFRSGDVSGARLLLERASEAGDARALFLLAETYDPRVLSTLRTRGIRGDAARAEELYARARALAAGEGKSSPSRRGELSGPSLPGPSSRRAV